MAVKLLVVMVNTFENADEGEGDGDIPVILLRENEAKKVTGTEKAGTKRRLLGQWDRQARDLLRRGGGASEYGEVQVEGVSRSLSLSMLIVGTNEPKIHTPRELTHVALKLYNIHNA
jgi:hypothetical protein